MRFQRRLSPQSKVDLVPMIDVVFQLVVFFMVSSTFNMTPAINLNLPSSTTADVVSVTNLTVTVRSESEIFLNQEPHDLASLNRRLAVFTAEEKEEIQSVMVQADGTVPYSLMISVLDTLREGGFYGISLKTLMEEAP